jgi:hypothetical protein
MFVLYSLVVSLPALLSFHSGDGIIFLNQARRRKDVNRTCPRDALLNRVHQSQIFMICETKHRIMENYNFRQTSKETHKPKYFVEVQYSQPKS